MRRIFCGSGSRLIGVLLLILCLASPLASESLLDVPPFDQNKTYQVSGMQLEALRLDWIKLEGQLATLNQQLTQSEESFGTYRRAVDKELLLWQLAAGAGLFLAGAAMAWGFSR